MSATTTSPQKVWTEAEIQALPHDGYHYEVVNGELVMRPKEGFQHAEICARLQSALGSFVAANRLGVVVSSNTGFWMFNRNCRAPDVSFVPKSRLATLGFKPNETRFFPGAPDLAVEVLSENSTRAEIDERLKDFFASGTRIAWVIEPAKQHVEVCHSPTQRKLIGAGGLLEGEDLLPGFQFPIADLFKEWDWD